MQVMHSLVNMKGNQKISRKSKIKLEHV